MKHFLLLLALMLVGTLEASADLSKLSTVVDKFNRYKNSKVSAVVWKLGEQKPSFERSAGVALIPASVLKVLTSYAALQNLGSGHHFETELWVDKEPGSDGAVGALTIRGNGDPSLVNERLDEIARELFMRGVRDVERVRVDDSLFVDAPQASGVRAYATGLGASVVNFNSLTVHLRPMHLGQPPVLLATPLAFAKLENAVRVVPGLKKRLQIELIPARDAAQARLRVSGELGIKNGIITVHRSIDDPAWFTGAVLSAHLRRNGIGVRLSPIRANVSPTAKLLMTSRSKELGLILRDLNNYSNNFIAGQLLYALGRGPAGSYRLDVALANVELLLQRLGIDSSSFRMVDGSGLSRENRASCQLISRVLGAIYEDFSASPEFISSLSRFGESGTLKRRQLDLPAELQDRAAGVWAKTGTLDGVSSIAGYFPGRDGSRYSFCLISNSSADKETASRIEHEFISTALKES